MFRAPLPHAMRPFDHGTMHYSLTVDSTVTREDVTSQPFWANLAGRLRVGNLVDIYDPAGAMDVQVRVLSVNNGIVKVRILRAYFDQEVSTKAAALLDPAEPVEEVKEMFKWRDGGDAGFAIINQITKQPVKRGIATKKQAMAECAQLNASAAAGAAV